jgi:hypothetical protein
VNENGDSPLEAVVCGRCATVCAPEDNFCRNCGLALAEPRLPAVRSGGLPVLSSPAIRSVVVKGATVVAAGVLAETLARRAVRSVLRRVPSRERLPARGKENGLGSLPEGTALESETFLLRRVRVKR